jgi:hypothetical protein
MSEFRKAKQSVEVTPGESVRILRELQELSQNALADRAQANSLRCISREFRRDNGRWPGG